MNLRMVPLASVAERLYRVVRQTAKELDKRANLDIRGTQTELDRSVLEKMVSPIEHLLRNAVAHGLESHTRRLAAGKPEQGEIVFSVRQEGNEIVMELADDGNGLDYPALRAKAQQLGLLASGQPADEAHLAQLIFLPGFTTAEHLSSIAGRGIGMDVVRTETMGLGGRIEVSSQPGQGTVFRIYLPVTLSIAPVLLVKSGTRSYAIPSAMVEQALEMKPEAIATVRAAGIYQAQDAASYRWHYLPRLLGDVEARPETQHRYWLILIKGGMQRIAVEIDALVGNQEVVVKNVGAQLARVAGIAGATVLDDGEITLILNPVALASREPQYDTGITGVAFSRTVGTAIGRSGTPARLDPAATKMPEPTQSPPTVLVVDDSITVRKVATRQLERAGYRVLAAKDGVDALEQMQEIIPDVMLADIEMPRMDGFDLARNVRGDGRLKHLPIIMITSRIADKHRNYAFEIGVNHYLGKPYDEQEMLRLVAGYIKPPG
jgi:chemosensory pili system protein ChpA (sensor histidine kinase/response regulator)